MPPLPALLGYDDFRAAREIKDHCDFDRRSYRSLSPNVSDCGDQRSTMSRAMRKIRKMIGVKKKRRLVNCRLGFQLRRPFEIIRGRFTLEFHETLNAKILIVAILIRRYFLDKKINRNCVSILLSPFYYCSDDFHNSC